MIRKFTKKKLKFSINVKMLNDFQKFLTPATQVAWILIARCWRTRPGSPLLQRWDLELWFLLRCRPEDL